MIKIHYLVLFFVYLIFGIAGYSRYGNDLSYYDSGIILLNPEFSNSPYLYCNLLVVLFVMISQIVNFKPQKNILTFLFRKREEDGVIWHYTSILSLHCIQVFIACIIIYGGLKMHRFVLFAYGLFTPFVKYVFPLIVYNKCFYAEKKYMFRRGMYYLIMIVGFFINFLTVGNMFIREIVRNYEN